MRIPIISKFFEKRSMISPYQSWFSGQSIPGYTTATNTHVTPETAMQVTPVFACVRILAETLASLPLIVYQRFPDGKKERAVDHPLYKTLHDKTNRWQTSFEWREMMQGHLALRGNAYSEIVLTRNKIELLPIHPDRIRPKITETGSVIYEIRGNSTRIVPGEKILHLRGLSTDGLTGLSPIQVAKETIGTAKDIERYGAKYFTNGARPGGVLETPAMLSDNARKNLKKSWNELHQGTDNAHRIAVLEEGVKWTQIGMSNEDSQFLESRKFSVEEVARIFRIPLHMIQSLDRSTFSNIVHQSLEFVQFTMLPWLRRWEQRINADLFTEDEQTKFYVEFLVDGLLRGDIESRYKAYSIGRQWGWLSANDIRGMENQNPIEGGDIYLNPLNMVPSIQMTQNPIQDK